MVVQPSTKEKRSFQLLTENMKPQRSRVARTTRLLSAITSAFGATRRKVNRCSLSDRNHPPTDLTNSISLRLTPRQSPVGISVARLRTDPVDTSSGDHAVAGLTQVPVVKTTVVIMKSPPPNAVTLVLTVNTISYGRAPSSKGSPTSRNVLKRAFRPMRSRSAPCHRSSLFFPNWGRCCP
ncbi:uncharacterized protein LOC132380512 isoform X3 [Hypanus sabinus]|uniref:uncharacterized protein LOC132380512 isoform X3 n=1 Tax=Hypanus sabinus TaxID=79690 RepID=UPI0028C4E21E|nr:uncharacterized protein LOC132380512 isoform X3 [Hypanus sabinus]